MLTETTETTLQIWAFLALACIFNVACGDTDDEKPDVSETNPRVETIAALQGDASEGEESYLNECEWCHLVDGRGEDDGGNGKNLVEWFERNPTENAVPAIIEGRSGMPAFAESFTDQDIADLVAYLDEAFAPR